MNIPNPGSNEAIEQGCNCPVLDNLHGKGFPVTTEEGELQIGYWMTEDCPLHGQPEFKKEDKQQEG